MPEQHLVDKGGNDVETPPPFFRKWSSMYAFVLGTLTVLILLFQLFTKTYQ